MWGTESRRGLPALRPSRARPEPFFRTPRLPPPPPPPPPPYPYSRLARGADGGLGSGAGGAGGGAKAAPAPKKVSAAAAAPKRAPPSKETAEKLYKDMQLGRQFEDMCAQMYYRGKMFGFVHLYNGQEAVSSGIIKSLREDDYVCSTYRDHVHALSKGVEPGRVMAELFGRATGICRGQGGSMHMFSEPHNMLGGFAFIGEGIPVATGAAFQTSYRRRVLGDEDADQVTCAFFGDGTCNNGAFYECLNMASLYKLPIIFCVENNKWAIGMDHNRATAPSMGDTMPAIYKKGPPFGMPGELVDGMDVLAVEEAAQRAIKRARAGEGPTLLELETYRYRGHSLADPDELRKQEEKDFYAARDPIPKFEKYLTEAGIFSQEDLDRMKKEVEADVEAAVEFADESPRPAESQLLENVFSDPKGFGIGEDGRYLYESAR